MGILKLYKKRGETPLECIKRYKRDNPEYENEKMTYAGRLDPLAEGLLLILTGDDCYRKSEYLALDKEYEVDILFGFATDTYDLLGIVTQTAEKPFVYDTKSFSAVLNSYVKKIKQKYPQYSSKYFKKTRSGELKDEEIVEKEVEIKRLKFLGTRQISKFDLEKYIIESINLVKGDFRQKEILKTWDKALRVIPAKAGIQNLDHSPRGDDNDYIVVSIRVNCTSGTYMRSLVNSIGEKIGIPALALNIKRTKLG